MILTCEHASNAVPAKYRGKFSAWLLSTHKAYDRGARQLAIQFGKTLGQQPLMGKYTRLLVDLNRDDKTEGAIKTADPLFVREYQQHRAAIERAAHKSFHLGIHTFTPILNGERRDVDIGILHSNREQPLARRWVTLLQSRTKLRVAANKPYSSDFGLTHALRQCYPGYNAIELEVNQRLLKEGRFSAELATLLAKTFKEAY